MRVWLYARLSNDDNPEMDALVNQQAIIRDYANGNGYRIVGESYDDNVSGMRFDRRGLEQLQNAAEAGQVDAVIVKDLSRLGRHQIQTALFIDYLRQKQVAVISVTENLNTMNGQDDLIVGIRGLMNDFYAKDIGNKIRHGYREKQKAGIVITPPFGYRKDRNTNCIYVQEEAAETVQMIYALYLQGCGQKEIARRLNRLGRKTPRQLHDERCRKAAGKYLWTYQSVKNVLMEIAYTGVLVNHRTETRCHKSMPVECNQQYRHENFYPVIIDRERWAQAQALLNANTKPFHRNTASHRYAGLLLCGDCGSTFVPRTRCWNGNRRVEYLCKSYMHHGKDSCLSHRIRESELDEKVVQFAAELHHKYVEEQADLKRLQRIWEKNRPSTEKELAGLQKEIIQVEQEIEQILLEQISKY